MLQYESVQELVTAAQEAGQTLSQVILKDQSEQMECSQEELFAQMRERFLFMSKSVENGLNTHEKSTSGLSGGDAQKLQQYAVQNRGFLGPVFDKAVAKALAVAEQNACMGKIVAAPTAGSCGILPAALLTVMEERSLPENDVIMALFTAAGIGMVIANKASVSGAEGGCQAECGSASAMAAAALTELGGGTPRMAAEACAMSLKGVLGLVCDPVAGLVEVPCVKRNAMGVTNAFTAAEMALAGVESRIPVDEVILAMKQVGRAMSSTLKETAQGGLADTPTGRSYKQHTLQI